MTDAQTAKLVRLLRERTKPLISEPADVVERLPEEPVPIRAVLFDVYGTLIGSGVGDIGTAQPVRQGEIIDRLLRDTGTITKDRLGPEEYAEEFLNQIQSEHERSRARGIVYPEVDILEVWETLLGRWTDGDRFDSLALSRLALEFECAINPVWPNPGCRQLLSQCRRLGLPMGIISNAQFYTPLLMEALLEQSLGELGFEPGLQIWSYRERRAKPDPELGEQMVRSLRKEHGIEPGETLFIGNDMLNDMLLAERAGFRGVLYAGDSRSFRPRSGDDRCRDCRPYAVVASLSRVGRLLPS